jgi:hypothetical protein
MISLFLRMKSYRILAIIVLTGLLGSCTPVRTKNIVDRVYELDPQGKIFVSPTLRENPPRTVAVLPFRSQIGEGRVEGSQELFNTLSKKDPSLPEGIGERMRGAFFGQFAQLEFDHVKISRIDRILRSEGLDTWEKMKSLPPQRVGELLQADAVIIGEVTHFDYYYAFLYSQLAVGLSLEMVDTRTGESLWKVHDARRDHSVRIVYDPIALVVGLFQVGFSMRPINMMRAMDEICRELVGTIPPPPTGE